MPLNPQCTGSITSSRHPLCLEINFFSRFLLRLSRIKPSQVMYVVKFGTTVLNVGYDFSLLVHFLGHRVHIKSKWIIIIISHI